MTRITINLPLVDALRCDGCTMLYGYYCCAFHDNADGTLRRLPECIAAEIEEVQP